MGVENVAQALLPGFIIMMVKSRQQINVCIVLKYFSSNKVRIISLTWFSTSLESRLLENQDYQISVGYQKKGIPMTFCTYKSIKVAG